MWYLIQWYKNTAESTGNTILVVKQSHGNIATKKIVLGCVNKLGCSCVTKPKRNIANLKTNLSYRLVRGEYNCLDINISGKRKTRSSFWDVKENTVRKGSRTKLRGWRRCKPTLMVRTDGDTADVGEGQHRSVDSVRGQVNVGDHQHTCNGGVQLHQQPGLSQEGVMMATCMGMSLE